MVNTKHVTVSHEVPRNPNKYQLTTHFAQRAKERLPENSRDRIIRETIKKGKVYGTTPPDECKEDGVRQYFGFERTINDKDYRVVVGIRPKAFKEKRVKHYAVTIIEVKDDYK